VALPEGVEDLDIPQGLGDTEGQGGSRVGVLVRDVSAAQPHVANREERGAVAEQRRWQVSIVGHGEEDPRTLLPHPQNPKVHPVEQDRVVRGSLDEVGWLRAVLKNRVTGHVLDGHARIKLAIEEGEATVPIDYCEVPAEKEGLVLRVLDQSAALAQVHVERWAALQRETVVESQALQAFFRAQAQRYGLNPDGEGRRPGAAVQRREHEGALAERTAALVAQWQVEAGQTWALGRHRLWCGDATEREGIAALCAGGRVALVVTSPPYKVEKGYERGASMAEHRRLLRGMVDVCSAVVVPGGFVVLNFADLWAQMYSAELTGSTRACCYPMTQEYWQVCHVEAGWDLYAQRVWYKPFGTLRQPLWTYHASLAHQQEFEHVWTWRTPGGLDEPGVFDWDVSSRAVWDTRSERSAGTGPSATWSAGYPVCLPERALRAHSAPGAVVWEPFLGSGTTLLACEALGRTCRGSDRDPGAIAVTLQRWVEAGGETPQKMG
jgi:hypothetical protein